jgi:hypothetical protein
MSVDRMNGVSAARIGRRHPSLRTNTAHATAIIAFAAWSAKRYSRAHSQAGTALMQTRVIGSRRTRAAWWQEGPNGRTASDALGWSAMPFATVPKRSVPGNAALPQ